MGKVHSFMDENLDKLYSNFIGYESEPLKRSKTFTKFEMEPSMSKSEFKKAMMNIAEYKIKVKN